MDISYNTVEYEAIEYLLPTEGNFEEGYPKLAYLNLLRVKCVDVKLLKKLITALPKLSCLSSELVVNALGDLTPEEVSANAGMSINTLCASVTKQGFTQYSRKRFSVLARSPFSQRFCNFSVIDVAFQKKEKQFLTVVLNLLNLKSVTLRGVLINYEHQELLSLDLLNANGTDV